MNEENSKVPSQDEGIPTSAPLNKENTEAVNDAAENRVPLSENVPPVNDVSKVKIRTVLKHRIRNWKPGVRRAIAYILVAVIFFAAGFGADRAIMRHRGFRGYNERPGIQRNLQGGKAFNNKQFKNRNGAFPGKMNPNQNQNQKPKANNQ